MSKVNVKIRIADVTDIAFSYRRPPGALPEGITTSNYGSNIKTHIEVNEPNQQVLIRMLITLSPRPEYEAEYEDAAQLPNFQYEGIIAFAVTGLNELIQSNEEGIGLPVALAEKLMADAFSTFRGIITSKCAGTPLQHVYVPLLNAKQLDALLEQSAK